ncbi:hypothetical protein [Acidipropionibacterium acidipropionici]|uniref:hypothetical protein n=1 Tax=Acidipropionibacterium acidipropionici TaxID=1748 RepID=UPI00110A6854|nr:hypothetical protein [Acidipropionibacterium acidipropionici]QCV96504.1 hypothetical protein FEZ30_15720 [Acidipropionibacterium acidipropionici]
MSIPHLPNLADHAAQAIVRQAEKQNTQPRDHGEAAPDHGPDEMILCGGLSDDRGLTGREVVVHPGGQVEVQEPGELTTRPLTVLPHEVMGGGLRPIGWEEAAWAIRDLERGRPGREVVVHPGGQVEVQDPDEPTPRPLTVLPHEIMAAAR